MISGEEQVKKIKRDTQIVVLSVLVLTIITLNVSYSAFFSVKTQSSIKELKTGDLNVTIDATNNTNGEDLYPTDESLLPTAEESEQNFDSNDWKYTTLTLTNDGSLDAEFSVTISNDTNLPQGKSEKDLISLSYLKIGIYDVTNDKWVAFDAEKSVFTTAINGLTPTDENENSYPILRDVVEASKDGVENSNVRTYRIYVWLDDETPISEIGKLVYLKLDIKSATVEGRDEAQEYQDPSISG